MVPLQIDAGPGRRLAAMYHPPSSRVNGRAVLIINPLGQEAVRAHRLLRVLSDRLARQGVHVLRFDFHGCGDSSGDDLDGEMEGWQGDLLAAHAWLLKQTGVQSVGWMGIRLGFAVGWLAAWALNTKKQGNAPASSVSTSVCAADSDAAVRTDRQVVSASAGVTASVLREPMPLPGPALTPGYIPARMPESITADTALPDRLIGWDAVASGRAYLDRLWEDHQAALKRAFSLPTIPDRQLRRQSAEKDLSEAMGFGLSSRLVAQIRELDWHDWTKPPLAKVNVLMSKDALPWPVIIKPAYAVTQAAAMMAAGRAPVVHLESVDVDFDWTSEEALNTPLVPDMALRRLLPWLSETHLHD
ncbi:MAG: hypothetical protein Q4A16_07195 [Lautropia sp.]|nr:hypothetical protein [Lautropia sp.]